MGGGGGGGGGYDIRGYLFGVLLTRGSYYLGVFILDPLFS